ncbi:hypothetical protein QWY85_02450 [Neolewinella lacunae]|uniref:Uncharacterized protein n=1 Tax=Neolewinella lacunae TaxID=1517758 RepID=A0A923PNH8_9BACT|nr:hypothetical protein [Neolewinella lacunae]MBC6994921.1 hypothetical protein [Neolewinella lacunae]MDN3633500.1 hypothetical protein [Neolewinella lacunae]
MKRLLFTLLTSIFFLQLSAQEVGVTNENYKKLNYESLVVLIDADPDLVEEKWEDFWDDRYDVNIKKFDRDNSGTAYLGEQVALPIISPKNVNLYSKISPVGNETRVTMAMAFSENDIVTRGAHGTSFVAAEAMMKEFSNYFYTGYFDEQLEAVRDELKDVRDDRTDASDDVEKAKRKIEKYEKKIKKYQDRIDKEREEVGDELETAEEKARRIQTLEAQLRELERLRARYLG